jgi:hypothetical protein
MKTALAFAIVVSSFVPTISAQDLISAQDVVIVDQAANQQTVEYAAQEKDDDGNLNETTHRYVRLALGLNRWDAEAISADGKLGAWVPASSAIEIINDNAVVRHAQYSAIWSGSITDKNGTFDLLMPDGQTRLVMQPLGIAYTDATGKSAFIAECQDTVGEVLGETQVIYPNCFNFLKGSIRYTASLSGVEQDCILDESPPPPETYGIDPATAKLECWTLVVNRATPTQKISRTLEKSKGNFGTDDFIDFGSMQIPMGKAFNVGSGSETLVLKEWVDIDTQTYLIESVDLADVKDDLKALPKAEARNLDKGKLKQIASSRKRTRPVSFAALKKDRQQRRRSKWLVMNRRGIAGS